MMTSQIEIIDVQLHAWFEEDMTTLFTPHQPATLNRQVFQDTLNPLWL